jgi:hypothetical protein
MRRTECSNNTAANRTANASSATGGENLHQARVILQRQHPRLPNRQQNYKILNCKYKHMIYCILHTWLTVSLWEEQNVLIIQQPIEQLTSSAIGGENLHQARAISETAAELAK